MKPVFLLAGLLIFLATLAQPEKNSFTHVQGAIVKGDSNKKELALVFTADEFGDGLRSIRKTLKKIGVKAAFFFTGRFYRQRAFQKDIKRLQKEGHYFGPHSDRHLLYCDWTKRDSLLVTKDSFDRDIAANLETMRVLGLPVQTPHLFIPPFEWWNDFIAAWSAAKGLRLFNFTPGIRTAADYTWPEMGAAYKSDEWILTWLNEFMQTKWEGLNGAIVLLHAGTDPRRKDKLYKRLEQMIDRIKKAGFVFVRIDHLLTNQ